MTPTLADLADGLRLLPGDTVIALRLGGLYALAAIGLVLIYRVSGVLNFAHGAVSMFATFVAYQVAIVWGLPAVLGLVCAILVGAFLGLVIEALTIRPLSGRPALAKVAITIGWLLVLQTAAGLIWSNTQYHQAVELVSQGTLPFAIFGVRVSYSDLAIILIAIVLAAGIAVFLRVTTLGTAMRAVADDPDAARLWGIRVDRVTAASWALGSALGALAGVLITPTINFSPVGLTVLVIDAFAAALIGRLQSLPLTCLGAVLLGMAQTYPGAFWSNSGAPEVATFVLVLATLAILFRPGVQGLRRV